jgi:hypothetical protein
MRLRFFDDNNGSTNNPLAFEYKAGLEIENAYSGAAPSTNGTKIAKLQLTTVTSGGYGATGSMFVTTNAGTGYNSGELVFSVGSNSSGLETEAMRINKDGNVGIGTTGVIDKLTVQTSSSALHATTLTKGTNTPGIWVTTDNNDNNMSGIHLASGGGTHFSSIVGARTANASHWGTHLAFYTHTNDTSALNTATEKMRINGNGQVTTPNQPAWSAGGGGWHTTAAGGVLPLASVVMNIGNHYTGSSARFTAPVAGVYQVNTIFYMETTGQAVLKKNGSDYVAVDTVIVGMTNDGTNSKISSSSISIYLSANDYIQLGGRNGQTVKCYLGHTFFSGHLVG